MGLQTADAIVVMENDELHKICSQLLSIKRIAFRDINRVICHKLTSFLQPAQPVETRTGYGKELGSKLQLLVPHPDHKLLTIRNIPQVSDRAMEFSTFQWTGLLKHLRQMLIASAPMEEDVVIKVGMINHASSEEAVWEDSSLVKDKGYMKIPALLGCRQGYDCFFQL
nr:hypothetical protein BaRGS_005021 [Batillaria attramentaria]